MRFSRTIRFPAVDVSCGDSPISRAASALPAGYPQIFPIMIMATIFGLILGVAMIIKGKLDSSRLKHFFKCCCCINYDREEGKKNLPPKNNEAVRIPFGVAIAAGTWCGLLINAIARG